MKFTLASIFLLKLYLLISQIENTNARCLNHQYNVNGTCYNCDTSCWSCEGTETNCTSCLGDNEDPKNHCKCVEGSYLSHGRCIRKCSLGCVLCNSIRGECEKCDVQQLRILDKTNHTCKCFQGYKENTENNNSCEPCFTLGEECYFECPDHYRGNVSTGVCDEDYYSFTKKTLRKIAAYIIGGIVSASLLIICYGLMLDFCDVCKKKKDREQFQNEDYESEAGQKKKKEKMYKNFANSSTHHFEMNTKSQDYKRFHEEIEKQFEQSDVNSKDFTQEKLQKHEILQQETTTITNPSQQQLSNTFIFNKAQAGLDLENLNDMESDTDRYTTTTPSKQEARQKILKQQENSSSIQDSNNNFQQHISNGMQESKQEINTEIQQNDHKNENENGKENGKEQDNNKHEVSFEEVQNKEK